MKNKSKLKSLPALKTDKQAEEFVQEADLTEYDFSGFTSMKFEFASKSARINMRLPESLLSQIKELAEKKGISYSSLIRMILETVVEKEQRSSTR